jgi:hypothetical protein
MDLGWLSALLLLAVLTAGLIAGCARLPGAAP